MSSQKFIRFGPTLNASKHDLIPATQNIYELIKKQPKRDWYLSIYRYSDHHFEAFKKSRSVAGIKDVTTNKVVFDFDSKTEPVQAQKDAIAVCERLMALGIPEDKLRIYFSGNKGFHVEVLSKQEFTRNEFENIITNIAGDLETFDTKIKDEARVLRAPLSRHPETGLYKIPISFEDIKTADLPTIRGWAADNKINPEDIRDELYEMDLPQKVIALKDVETEKKVEVSDKPILGFDIKDIDFSKCPKWMSKERYALQEGFFYGSESVSKGERNTAFMILAATYRAQGFSADHALMLLSVAAEKQSRRTGESQVPEDQLQREVIGTVYSPHWKGGIYGRDEELLILTRKRFNIHEEFKTSDLVKITDVGNRFKSFAKHIDQNTIKTGIPSIDDNVLITTGMMVGVLGAPSSGKTSFANTFVENLSRSGIPAIYYSLDMHDNLLYTRLLQKYSGYDMRKILAQFKEDKPDKELLTAWSQVLENYSNVSFNFRSGPTVEEIEEGVVQYKDQTGKHPKLLVVDYLEKVRGPYADPTANGALVASRLSDIAKTHDLTVVLLLQPQKNAGDPREELLSMRKVKGASVIEQDCRVILTVWRPGFNPKDSSDDKFTSIAVVKNNMGGLCQLDFGWDGVTGQLTELDSTARFQLKDLRERLAEEKAAQSNGYDL